MEHKKHKSHPHDKVAAMPQFKDGHFEKKMSQIETADGKYSGEMSEAEEYKKSTDALASYAKKHKAKH